MIYWNKKRCEEEALRYNTRSNFRKGAKGAYSSALKNGWLDEICSHMSILKKKSGYWTKERCEEEALRYNTRSELRDNSIGAYSSALKNGWLDEICSHMPFTQKKKSGYWTKEKCEEEALKYSTIKDFRENSISAYNISIKMGWLKEICPYSKHKPKGYWTKERCEEEALKYNTKSDFERCANVAYQKSIKMGWVDDICSHMTSIGNKYKRCIYVVEFSDGNAYIGLTYNFKVRKQQHLNAKRQSSVYKHMIKSKLTPIFKQVSEYLPCHLAQKKEEDVKNDYEQNGWVALNRLKCGGLGSNNRLWTKEKCLKEGNKYKTITQFKTSSPGAYDAAYRNGWLNDHFNRRIKK